MAAGYTKGLGGSSGFRPKMTQGIRLRLMLILPPESVAPRIAGSQNAQRNFVRFAAALSLFYHPVKRREIDKINLRLQKLLDSFLDELIDRETFTAEKSRLMSQKKTLEEQGKALSSGRADWLEPMQNWVLTAKNAGEIAVSGSLQEERVLALKVFGSNLVLDCKKARGYCVKPWSLLVEKSVNGGMVRLAGIEPTTFGLEGRCSIQLSYRRDRCYSTACD